MARKNNQSFMVRKQATGEVIERYMDETSLTDVLDLISDICYGKSHHISEAWQDKQLAFQWQRAAVAVQNAANSPKIRKVSG
jgi:hypothetical protein